MLFWKQKCKRTPDFICRAFHEEILHSLQVKSVNLEQLIIRNHCILSGLDNRFKKGNPWEKGIHWIHHSTIDSQTFISLVDEAWQFNVRCIYLFFLEGGEWASTLPFIILVMYHVDLRQILSPPFVLVYAWVDLYWSSEVHQLRRHCLQNALCTKDVHPPERLWNYRSCCSFAFFLRWYSHQYQHKWILFKRISFKTRLVQSNLSDHKMFHIVQLEDVKSWMKRIFRTPAAHIILQL